MLIDSLLSFSVVALITLTLLPMYFTLSETYEKKKAMLEAYRIAYVEIVINERKGYVDGDKLCYELDKIYCVSPE